MAVKRKIIQIDDELCDGCGQCVPACAEGAIQIVDGKARLVADQYCDGLGACMGECPTGALQIIEREAEEFDEEAVAEYLQSAAVEEKAEDTGSMACGCPSSQIRTFQPAAGSGGQVCASEGASPSKLSHWPVQIRLVPPGAPFLKGADLLVAADCTPFAYRISTGISCRGGWSWWDARNLTTSRTMWRDLRRFFGRRTFAVLLRL